VCACGWAGCYKSTVALCHRCCLAPYHHTPPTPAAATVSATTIESNSPVTRIDILHCRRRRCSAAVSTPMYNTHPDFQSNFMVKKCVLYSKFYGKCIVSYGRDDKRLYLAYASITFHCKFIWHLEFSKFKILGVRIQCFSQIWQSVRVIAKNVFSNMACVHNISYFKVLGVWWYEFFYSSSVVQQTKLNFIKFDYISLKYGDFQECGSPHI